MSMNNSKDLLSNVNLQSNKKKQENIVDIIKSKIQEK